MKATKRFLPALITTTLTALALVGAVPAAAHAAGPASETDELTGLRALSNAQSREAIDALLGGDDPVSLYVDARTGEVLAAEAVADRALNPIGPGCTSTSVCMRSITGTPYGLAGSGTRTGSWKKIISYSTGDRRTSFWASNGMAYTYRANATVTLNVTVTMTKVQR